MPRFIELKNITKPTQKKRFGTQIVSPIVMAAPRPLGPGIESRPLLLQDGMRVGSEFIIRPDLLEDTSINLDAIRPVADWCFIGYEGLRHLDEEHFRHLQEEEEDLSDEKDGEDSDGEQGDWNEQAWQDWLSKWNEQGDCNVEQAWQDWQSNSNEQGDWNEQAWLRWYLSNQGDWNEQAWQDYWLSNWNEQGDWNEQGVWEENWTEASGSGGQQHIPVIVPARKRDQVQELHVPPWKRRRAQEHQVQEQVFGQEVKKEIDGKQVDMEIRGDPLVKDEHSQVQEQVVAQEVTNEIDGKKKKTKKNKKKKQMSQKRLMEKKKKKKNKKKKQMLQKRLMEKKKKKRWAWSEVVQQMVGYSMHQS